MKKIEDEIEDLLLEYIDKYKMSKVNDFFELKQRLNNIPNYSKIEYVISEHLSDLDTDIKVYISYPDPFNIYSKNIITPEKKQELINDIRSFTKRLNDFKYNATQFIPQSERFGHFISVVIKL